MRYKIVVDPVETIDELKKMVQNGARFIVFSYTVSLVAITLRRLSPAILVKDKVDIRKHRKYYNTISAVFGWWGIPWGLVYTIESFKTNRNGGVDVTEDIMHNIDETSLQAKEVQLELIIQLFNKPNKSDIECFRKALPGKLDFDFGIERIIVGLFMNTEGEPYHVVGIKTSENFDATCASVRKALYTQFYKHVYFEFVDLRLTNEVNDALLKQGEIIIGD